MIKLKGRRFLAHTLSRSSALIKYGYSTAIIWLISLLLSAPICIYQKVVDFGIKDLVLYHKCVENWPTNNRGIYSFVILITQLLIPSSVMLVSHYRIRGHLNRHRIRRPQSNYSSNRDGQPSNSSIRSENIENNNSIEENQRYWELTYLSFFISALQID